MLDNEVLSLAIVVATSLEAAPLLDLLELSPVGKVPCLLHRRESIALAISGIGKTNAAIATTYCCAMLRPRWILNVGAAGATDSRCPRGDFFHATKVIEPDRPGLGSGQPCVQAPNVLEGFVEATLATHDRPIISREERERVSPYASLVDMEGAAIVQASRRFKAPCALFKFVSDTPEDTDVCDAIAFIEKRGKVFSRFIADSVIPRLR
jgi:adenosylhomocysteine nucleosidase